VDDLEWTSLLDSLAWIERVRPGECGLLSFGTSGHGAVFVEDGRICWIAAEGLQDRLRDLLCGQSSAGADAFERVLERCRAEGGLFARALVANGLIQRSGLEAVLRRHSAESLIQLCATREPRFWSSRGGRSYASEFTFLPREVLFDVADLVLPELRAIAERELSAVSAEGRLVAAFLLDPAREANVPVAAAGDDVSVSALRELGDWAARMPAATRELAAVPAFVLTRTLAGDTVSIWWRGPLLYAAVCEDQAGAAAVTAHHLVQRHASVR
jgi:hypothetical protein